MAETEPPDEPPREPGRLAPAELGARLTAARAAAGMAVEDVASRTRIRVGLIRSMEAGDFAPCGGAVYARGHLRSIAHVVGADDAALVAAYDSMAGQPSPSAATVVDEHYDSAPAAVPFARVARTPFPAPVQVTGTAEQVAAPPPRTPRPAGSGLVLPGSSVLRERRGSPWVLAAIGAAALVVVVSAVALATGHHGSGGTAVAAGPKVSSSAPVARSTPTPSPTAPVTLADAGVTVAVTVSTSASWVHVVDATGALVFQGVLTPGSSRSFHSAAQLKFIFGYAPAIRLVVNGHEVGSPPANGGSDVADAVFDPTSGG